MHINPEPTNGKLGFVAISENVSYKLQCYSQGFLVLRAVHRDYTMKVLREPDMVY